MAAFLSELGQFFLSISWIDIVDILILTILIYYVLKFFKNTKAIHVLKGLAILVVALAVASWLGLPSITWLLSSVLTSGLVIIIVLFQPELRRGFENIGRGHFLQQNNEETDMADTVEELVNVCEHLSRRRVGALMVFAGKSALDDIVDTGTALDAHISCSLVENVFEPNTPLHDGAMVIKGQRIVAAGCFLPLSENNEIEKTLGTRHRAALGISECSDATVIVVSEETGVISMAQNGAFQRYLDLKKLRAILSEMYASYREEEKKENSFQRFFNRFLGKEGEEDNEK